jgi:adenylate cyclase
MAIDAAAAGFRRKRAAILFADVFGYSRLMSSDEQGTIDRVSRAIALFRLLIGDYGGEVINTAGDSVLAVFDTADPALAFAVAIQREFQKEAVWNTAGEPLRFRIGLHIGEIVASQGNVSGHQVNIASRLQEIAPPGGICLSGALRDVLSSASSVVFRPLGRPQLKNIDQTIEAFVVMLNDHLEQTAATPAPAYPPLSRPGEDIGVAVLPFANLSRDPADQHLIDGVAGDMIANLSRFRDLAVIAQHSAFLFRDLRVSEDEIARQLGVRYLVRGGLQRAGDRIRVRVELFEASSGRVLWAEHYNGNLEDIFAFQDDMTSTVAARLVVQISAAERRRLETRHTPDLQAYGLVLRGQDLIIRFRKETNLHARRLFEQAAECDPDYSRSYTGMSRTFNLAWRYSWSDDPDACLDRALELAAAAIRHDDLDARAHAELAYAHLYRKEHEAALAAYERALELNPNDADIIAEYADALVYEDQPQRSIVLLERAMRLNPYHPDWYLWYLADAYNVLRQPEDVIATVQRMRDPSEGRRLLAASYAHLGKLEEAQLQARELLRVHPNFTVSSWAKRPPYHNREGLEYYLDGLRKAGLPE